MTANPAVARLRGTLGQRHEPVIAAAKAANSQLQAKVKRRDVSEADLVKQVFSEKPPAPGKSMLGSTRLRIVLVAHTPEYRDLGRTVGDSR